MTISPPTILVVDDTLINLEILKKMLDIEGYTILTASNGAAAIIQAQSTLPDLILLDIMMPEMNGYEVCNILKNTPETKHIPIIFVSALYEIVDKVKAFQAGGVDFITKPFQVQDVMARVRIHLELQQARKLLASKNKQLEQEIIHRKHIEGILIQQNYHQNNLLELQKNLLQSYPRTKMYPIITTLLGQTLQISRVTIYEHEPHGEGQIVAKLQAEWCGDLIPSQGQISTIYYNQFDPQWLKTLQQGHPLIIITSEAQPHEQDWLNATQTLSFLAIPLLLRNKLLGFIGLSDNQSHRDWRVEELDWLWVGASSISLYLDKQQSERTLQEAHDNLAKRVGELAIINHIAQLITKLTHIEPIFQIVLEELSHFVQTVHICASLLDLSKTNLNLITSHSTFGAAEKLAQLKGMIIPRESHRAEHLTIEAKHSLLFSHQQTDMFDPTTQEWFHQHGIGWILIVPLLAHDEVIGLISLKKQYTQPQFTATEINFIETVASQVAGAIEIARLIEETQQAKEIAETINQALHKANETLSQLANMDGLTQIANRRQFDQYLAQIWQESSLTQNRLTLILCDVDYFKRYNDHYGHQVGDTCLQQVAQALKRSAKRPRDLVARYGGEEFAIILPQTDSTGAITVAQTIQREMEALQIPHATSSVNSYVTLSIGSATMKPQPHVSIERLLAQADQALYQAKKQGRNQIVVANSRTYP